MNRESHPQGITSPRENKVLSWGTTSPLGVKVCLYLGVKLKLVLYVHPEEPVWLSGREMRK
jgi:hypothetical protein